MVKIDDQQILVEYSEEEEGRDILKQYCGANDGTGHLTLDMNHNGISGRATLHMFPGSTLLVGNWVEGSIRGMWSILLG